MTSVGIRRAVCTFKMVVGWRLVIGARNNGKVGGDTTRAWPCEANRGTARRDKGRSRRPGSSGARAAGPTCLVRFGWRE